MHLYMHQLQAGHAPASVHVTESVNCGAEHNEHCLLWRDVCAKAIAKHASLLIDVPAAPESVSRVELQRQPVAQLYRIAEQINQAVCYN